MGLNGQNGPRDPLSLVMDRLDIVIDLLRFQVGLEPQYMPELRVLQSPAAVNQDVYFLMEHFLAAALPSAPMTVEAYVVGNLPVRLAENQAVPLMRVEVANDNVAQPLWISTRGVLVTTGRQLLPQAVAPFVLPFGHEIWGICPVPNISVRVSIGYDFLNMLEAMRRQRRQQEGT